MLRLAVAVLYLCGGEVAVLAVDEEGVVDVSRLSEFEVKKHPENLEVAAVARLVHP